MTTTTTYKCEICGSEYNNQEACEKCEKSHKTKYENANRDKFSRMSPYPSAIVVKFDDDPDDTYVAYSFRNAYTYKERNTEENTEENADE